MRNALSSPFEVGRHGSKLECQVKSDEFLAQNSSAWSLLNELRPSAVICECEPVEPGTGDIVLAWCAASRTKEGGDEAKGPLLGHVEVSSYGEYEACHLSLEYTGNQFRVSSPMRFTVFHLVGSRPSRAEAFLS